MIVQRPTVPLLVPDLPDRNRLWPYLQRMDEARQYSNFGPLARELESRLGELFSARAGASVHVTTVSSCTLGLELALASMNLPAGSRILVPALTFIATATAVLRAGHVPVICDIDASTWSLTPAISTAMLDQERFDAVMPVTAFGQAQICEEWQRFERECGPRVLIDAAAGFGSQWAASAKSDARDSRIHSTIVFSLHTTKSLPAGEGGLVVSTDAEQIRQIRQRSNFGINLDPSSDVPVGSSSMLGTNAKLSEYHAAVGLASLERWPQRAAVRREVMRRYREALSDAGRGELEFQGRPSNTEPVAAPTLMCVRWPGAGKAARLEQVCAEQGVMTRRWYQPLLHRHALIGGMAVHRDTPVADQLASELIGLPFFPDMSAEQIARVAQCVARVATESMPTPRRPGSKTSARHSSATNPH